MKKGDYKRTYLQMFNQFKEFSIFPMWCLYIAVMI
jgi:hypothetical protein